MDLPRHVPLSDPVPTPDAPGRDPAEETFRRFVAVGAGASLAWAPVWFLSGVPGVGAALLAAAAALAGAYASRRRLGAGLASHLAVGTAVLVVLGVVSVTGGIDGTRGAWVFVLPVAVVLPLGVRGAAVWGTLLVAAVAGLWVLELRGYPFPDLVPAGNREALGAAVHVTVLALTLLLSLAYARTRAATVRSLHAVYRRALDSEGRFRETLAAIERMVGHAVVITDLEGRITYAAGTERVHGWRPEDLVGRHVSTLGSNVPEAEGIAAELLEATTRGEPWTQAVTATRRSGENFPILISASPYYGSDGAMSGVVTIGVDLTGQVEGERRLMQSAKLAAIGELVAGVAHELNNPLTVVKTTATLLEASLEGEPAADARAIREHAERAARIVRGLLHFARRSPHERVPTDLNGVVERVCRFREEGLRAQGVELECRLAEGLPLTLADGAQLEQVLLNLLNNAEQAIAAERGQGRVVVSTGAGDGTLRLRVADDGPGIPEALQARVFDPFFTTRAVGEGTGLGLAVSHGIVAEHGGSILLHSEPGAGAVFTVELPVAPAASGGFAPPPPPAPEAPPAPLRVLVVDDEAGLRRIVRRYLEGRGHRVDEAASGAEALERIAAATPDAVVLDLKMPGMSGDELFRLLRDRHPEVAARVVFATGDVISPARKVFLEATGRPAFEKPYDLDQLARVVEEVP